MYNPVYVVVGARSSGKTPLILGGDYEKGMAYTYMNERKMSVLIIDEIDHPKYRHVPFLHPDQYYKLSEKPAIYRTLATMSDMPLLFPRLKDVWNTAIVFEDCHKYINFRLTKNQIAVIGNSKNQNNDIIFMHWSWGWVQKDLFRIANYYVTFKTSDSPEDRKKELKSCFPPVMKAWLQINKQGVQGKLPYLVVDSGI